MHLGKPVVYKVTKNFMKMFGISSLDDLPELPRYKLDENEQIVIDDVLNENEENSEEDSIEKLNGNIEDKEQENNENQLNDEVVIIENNKEENKDLEAPMPV